jgi:flagella basal body P-ring formation protein FlgA
MRFVVLCFTFLAFCSFNIFAESIHKIDSNCLKISDIANVDIDAPIKCGFDYGETYNLHKYKIRNLAQKYNISAEQLKYHGSITIQRKGKKLTEKKLKKILLKALKDRHPEVDIEIERLRLSKNIYTNEKENILIELPEETFGSTYLTVSNGINNFNVYAYIKGYKTVYVTTDRIYKEKPLKGKITLKKVDITNLRDEPVENPDKYISNRVIASGRILDKSMVMKKPDILKGEKVKIIFNEDNLRVSTEGILQEHAYIGKIVRVENTSSGKIISGKYIGNGQVTTTY